jgi:DNA-binding MarR family transcriptional regulator/GNAT superfamily N-acetyltransferase
MKKTELLESVRAVRRFNRFYTRQIGVLDEGLLESPFSLAEARVIYEIANNDCSTASELANKLGLDAGYLSRILKGLKKRTLIKKTNSAADARQTILTLSEAGRKEFAKLDRMSRDQIDAFLQKLSPSEQKRLLDSMKAIESLLSSDEQAEDRSFVLRSPHPGDFGWVIQRNGRLYADEYGWDETYEGLVATIIGEFVKNFDEKKERCWIAEKDGENVGSVFLVRKSPTVAQLRLLIVEPSARGLGLGKRLVDECTRFARQAGYKKITLWTNSILLAARSIYKKAGYQMTDSKKNHLFGHDLVSETWELAL